jgi:hypothetical protein
MSEKIPQPALTIEQEPAGRILDGEKAYWMGHAMVANMDKAVQLRHEASNPLEIAVQDSRGRIIGAAIPDVSRANAIQHERAADQDARQAERAYDDSKNSQDDETKSAGQNKLDKLTDETRLPHAAVRVEPYNVGEFKTQLEIDDTRQEKLDDLHETLFMQESQKILYDSRNIKIEADKLAQAFASGTSPKLEQAAKLSISNFNSALRDYFNPNRILEWQKRGQLNHAPGQINDALSSIALSGGLGETKKGRFIPEKLDLFKDPEDVTSALEFIGRRASGQQAIDIAQKSMRLLGKMQTYETIMSPTSKKLDPLEVNLKRISAMVGLDNEAAPAEPLNSIPEPDREANRRIVTEDRVR